MTTLLTKHIINELRRLAEDIHSSQGHNHYSKTMSLAADLLENLDASNQEWQEKTDWVQEGINNNTIPANYLGMHRADVLKDRLTRRVTYLETKEAQRLHRLIND